METSLAGPGCPPRDERACDSALAATGRANENSWFGMPLSGQVRGARRSIAGDNGRPTNSPTTLATHARRLVSRLGLN
ncbi:MAG: hypothetical protein KDA62_12660 [Planctomycetales bacterium]|nr:hypothetical protein [Planctomycetales bacterium]